MSVQLRLEWDESCTLEDLLRREKIEPRFYDYNDISTLEDGEMFGITILLKPFTVEFLNWSTGCTFDTSRQCWMSTATILLRPMGCPDSSLHMEFECVWNKDILFMNPDMEVHEDHVGFRVVTIPFDTPVFTRMMQLLCHQRSQSPVFQMLPDEHFYGISKMVLRKFKECCDDLENGEKK